MSYYLAPALDQLRAEVDALWPNRSRVSDGWIGDASHSARTSDHNPNRRGSVNAFDFTASGIDTGKLINAAKSHPSVRYIIFNRRIMNRDIGNFSSRHYSGSNPHTLHVHISLYQQSSAEQRTRSWGLADAKGGGTTGGNTYGDPKAKHEPGSRTLKLYSAGTDVTWLQQELKKLDRYTGGEVDGYYGPAMVSAVTQYQRSRGLSMVDGMAGSQTFDAIKSGAKMVADGAPSKPAQPKVPPFPLEDGQWMGKESNNPKNRSGVLPKDRPPIRQAQERLLDRGWNGVGKADGIYGPATEKVVRQFQREKGLTVDGLLGEDTWRALWTEPVT